MFQKGISSVIGFFFEHIGENTVLVERLCSLPNQKKEKKIKLLIGKKA